MRRVEVQHDVDEMLERAGPGDGAVLRDVPDQKHRHPGCLGRHGQRRRHSPHLGDAAGDAVGLGGGHGLHRVDHHQARLDFGDMAECHLQVRFGGQVDLVVGAAGAFGPQPDLAGRLLTGQIQCAPTCLRPAMGDLEQQRRLADAGVAGEQRHRAGDQTSAEDAVQLTDPGVEMTGAAWVDRADRHRGRGRRDRAARGRTVDRGQYGDFVDGAPGAAIRAAANPFGGEVVAFRTAIL
jgi:hypothetical protein